MAQENDYTLIIIQHHNYTQKHTVKFIYIDKAKRYLLGYLIWKVLHNYENTPLHFRNLTLSIEFHVRITESHVWNAVYLSFRQQMFLWDIENLLEDIYCKTFIKIC